MFWGNSSIMDVAFAHKTTNKILQKNCSSWMIQHFNAYYHSGHLAECQGQKNIVKPEKMWQTTFVMIVTQKAQYFGETIHYLKTLWILKSNA